MHNYREISQILYSIKKNYNRIGASYILSTPNPLHFIFCLLLKPNLNTTPNICWITKFMLSDPYIPAIAPFLFLSLNLDKTRNASSLQKMISIVFDVFFVWGYNSAGQYI